MTNFAALLIPVPRSQARLVLLMGKPPLLSTYSGQHPDTQKRFVTDTWNIDSFMDLGTSSAARLFVLLHSPGIGDPKARLRVTFRILREAPVNLSRLPCHNFCSSSITSITSPRLPYSTDE
jgi:hypothetical protein